MRSSQSQDLCVQPSVYLKMFITCNSTQQHPSALHKKLTTSRGPPPQNNFKCFKIKPICQFQHKNGIFASYMYIYFCIFLSFQIFSFPHLPPFPHVDDGAATDHKLFIIFIFSKCQVAVQPTIPQESQACPVAAPRHPTPSLMERMLLLCQTVVVHLHLEAVESALDHLQQSQIK